MKTIWCGHLIICLLITYLDYEIGWLIELSGSQKPDWWQIASSTTTARDMMLEKQWSIVNGWYFNKIRCPELVVYNNFFCSIILSCFVRVCQLVLSVLIINKEKLLQIYANYTTLNWMGSVTCAFVTNFLNWKPMYILLYFNFPTVWSTLSCSRVGKHDEYWKWDLINQIPSLSAWQ